MTISDISGKVTLSNGVEMPYLGLGVFQSRQGDEVIKAVNWALGCGYRHIDTAALYGNEAGVGAGIRQSGVPREEVFVVSKVWNTDQGYESTLKAFDSSLNRLKMDYLDLYLVHWPVKNKYKETWRALEKLYKEGRVKAIGVSNFLKYHLEDLFTSMEIMPMVNQMEFHPYLVQQDLVDFCQERNICYEAWSPIMKGRAGEVPLLCELGQKYNKTPIQVVLRWDLQKGIVTIPKSSKHERIVGNSQIFDFELSSEDVARIDQLDRGERLGPDPANFDF